MLEHRDRVLEYDPGSLEGAGDQEAEGGGGLRRASEAVTLVSASALVGGGIGVLTGVALEAINPFALGMVGVVLGVVLPALLQSVVGARGGVQRSWWRRTFGR